MTLIFSVTSCLDHQIYKTSQNILYILTCVTYSYKMRYIFGILAVFWCLFDTKFQGFLAVLVLHSILTM